MRSRTPLALVAAAALTFAACGGSSDDVAETSAPPVTDPPATEPVETEPPVTEPDVTEPPATQPPETEPADTEPADTEPATTQPPDTEPPATEPPDTAAAASELVFDTGRGEYQVGVTTLVVPDFTGRERPLTVDVWFPLADDATGPPHQYTLLPGTYYESRSAITADPASIADGPFPLVVYSHGWGGLRYIHSDYTEAIASNGYVVVAADHTGNTATDDLVGTRDEPAAIALNRPNDVTALIDAFLDPTRPETAPFVAVIDPELIAVSGHSFGGFTALAVASGYDNPLGAYEADTRVDAIIPIAPAAGDALLSDERLAAITVPMLLLGGTDDATTPIEPNVVRPWELAGSPIVYRADLVAAEHETFTDVCDYLDFLPTLPEPNQTVVDTLQARDQAGCDADDMPIDRAQSITDTLAVAFLDQVLKDGDPLTAADVDEQPDVIFLARS